MKKIVMIALLSLVSWAVADSSVPADATTNTSNVTKPVVATNSTDPAATSTDPAATSTDSETDPQEGSVTDPEYMAFLNDVSSQSNDS